MSKGKTRFSSLEVLLCVWVGVLLLVCVGLIVVSWLAINREAQEDEHAQTELSGSLTISKGVEFTPELLDSSSVQYKALVYDSEKLISEAYSQSSLKNQYIGCNIQNFRQGSVVVTFALSLRGVVGSEEAQGQLVKGLQSMTPGGLVVDPDSVTISVSKPTTTSKPGSTLNPTSIPTTTSSIILTSASQTSAPVSKPTTTSKSVSTLNPTSIPTTTSPIIPTSASQTSAPVTCPEGERMCGDGKTCVSVPRWCDGVKDCPDGTDEDQKLCATACDGQFVLQGPAGSFHSENFPLPYENEKVCRWIIRVQEGLSIKVDFHAFHTEQESDLLTLYEGVGPKRILTFSLSGASSPGTLWLLSDEATVIFSTDFANTHPGFNATFRAENISTLSNEQKVHCTFEGGMCFWRQEPEDDGDWIRVQGPTFPPSTGPSADHTLGNASGFYVVTPGGFGNWERSFKLHSLPLAPFKESVCLSFWYHMYGMELSMLGVWVESGNSSSKLFHKEDNYGDHWNYGRVTLNTTTTAAQTIVFVARKKTARGNDIALDDINLSSGACEGGPPDPTPVPTTTTPPPIAPDCGGPFDLWEPNSTFSSPNYPNDYGSRASCVWNLHAQEGRNIQLHFLDFALEATYDVIEVRDGKGSESELLGVLTGNKDIPDIFSTTNQMTVMLFTDSSGTEKGFRANFTSGIRLGLPEPCPPGHFQCAAGMCVSNGSVCDGVPDCPDASDEAQCVHLLPESSVNSTGEARLQVQVRTNRYTACVHNWTSDLSHYFCRYLGYRSGEASSVPARVEDSLFTSVSLRPDGSVHLEPKTRCSEDMVVALSCDNQPCGVRKVSNKTRSSSTWDDRGTRGTEEEEERMEERNRVVGGVDAEKGAWPWVVSLGWRGRHVCGASLIDKEWLITAAHCVYGKNIHLSNWVAKLGVHSQYSSNNQDEQNLQVDKVIMNSHYNRRTKQADIALMHLKTPANFTDYVQPVCLPHQQQRFQAGRKCVIAGWGRLEEGGAVADVLQEAEVPLVDQAQCQEWLPEYNITAQMVCAGFPDGGVDSCQGDSGGPLMCEDGRWVLVGATSFGVGCARPKRPGVYALVSEFIDWVLETRRQHSHWDGWMDGETQTRETRLDTAMENRLEVKGPKTTA